MSARESLRLAVAGDALITRRLDQFDDPDVETVYDEIREADVAAVNLEMLLHDYEGSPASADVAPFSGTYLRGAPWVADELEAAGFDLFAAASNHSGDYSHGGMEATMRELDERDLSYAGLGEDLADAREPTYVDTGRGRVAMVATASTVSPGTEAGRRRPDLPGRPGISAIDLDTKYVLPDEHFERLEEMSELLGLEDVKRQRQDAELPTKFGSDDDTFHFIEAGRGHSETIQFERGSEAHVYQKPDEGDVEAVYDRIAEASKQADWVVASIHAHEGVNGTYNDRTVAPFIEEFAKGCVDAGADAFMGHGPHTLRGIEVYDGAPLFYSLGNFISQIDAITRVPDEVYERYPFEGDDRRPSNVHGYLLNKPEFWETVLPVCSFEDGDLAEVELHPVELGYGEDQPRHGEPVRADAETADRILDRLADLSEPYGTEVVVEDGVGVIRP